MRKKLPHPFLTTFACFQKVDLIYSRVGAGAISNIYPEQEPYQNDADQQH
jgi:hypothetical protein